jgi:hypothetical protein
MPGQQWLFGKLNEILHSLSSECEKSVELMPHRQNGRPSVNGAGKALNAPHLSAGSISRIQNSHAAAGIRQTYRRRQPSHAGTDNRNSRRTGFLGRSHGSIVDSCRATVQYCLHM